MEKGEIIERGVRGYEVKEVYLRHWEGIDLLSGDVYGFCSDPECRCEGSWLMCEEEMTISRNITNVADRFLRRKATIGELRTAVKAAGGIQMKPPICAGEDCKTCNRHCTDRVEF